MKAIVTGASGGLGAMIARELAARGFELILVARRQTETEALAQSLTVKTAVLSLDLCKEADCFALYENAKGSGVDLLVNNAGCGVFGSFSETDLSRELAMLDLNIRALHILIKLFLQEFTARGYGMILNVASVAAFAPGPLLSAYYASKSYVLRLDEAIAAELRYAHSGVSICTLCPGPIATDFNQNAGVLPSRHGANAQKIAAYAVKHTLKGKSRILLPGLSVKLGAFATWLLPARLTQRFLYRFQQKKRGKRT